MLSCGVSMRYLCAPSLWFLFQFTHLSIMPVDLFFSGPLVMILNHSSSFLSAMCCVSFIVVQGAFVVGCFNASTESIAASIAASADDTLGIFKF